MKVVVFRLGSLGDTIVSLPCLHRVRKSFPEAERILLTNNPVSKNAPRMQDILQGSDLVHRAITYDVGTRSPMAIGALWLKLARLRADILVYLTSPRGVGALRRDLAFFSTCGIKRVIGAPTTDDLLNNRIDQDGQEEYECERLARCLAPLGTIDLDDSENWLLGLSADETHEAARMLHPLNGQPFIAVNMGGKAEVNDWGHANWTALFRHLTQRFGDHRWVFVGAPQDFERAEDIVATHPGEMLNLCGKLSIRATAAVLRQASLFAGHDSGPLHLAAASGVPCVGIFGDLNRPHKWFPYGERHRILYPSGPISTTGIDRVFEAIAAAAETIGDRRDRTHVEA